MSALCGIRGTWKMDNLMDGWMYGSQRALNVCCLCHPITAFFEKRRLVCAKHPFCFHFQTVSTGVNVAIVSLSLLDVFETKSAREIWKSKFSTEKHQSGKGLRLWSHICCFPGLTSNPAALPLSISPSLCFPASQNEMLKCFSFLWIQINSNFECWAEY